jgi:putative 4-mercaptohistidine N1-methyltranferase
MPPLQQDVPKEENVYESTRSLHEYLMMHFGTKTDLIEPEFEQYAPLSALDFPKRCAEECWAVASDPASAGLGGSKARVLDAGCAVGRSTFELARFFEDCVGMDFSQSFIDAANALKEAGTMGYTIATEGDLTKPATATVDSAIDRQRTTFKQGDACSLTAEAYGGKFGVILAANLLCRLPKPRAFLDSLPDLLVPGGLLVMPSPYTWLESYTRKEDWIGGYTDAEGNPVTSFEGLQKILGPKFDLVKTIDMPFFIRETRRKNQWSVSHCTIWRLK